MEIPDPDYEEPSRTVNFRNKSKCMSHSPSAPCYCRQSLLEHPRFVQMHTAASIQQPGDSPSMLLCSSGSVSAYATGSSLLRAAHPIPPNFPPPRRRTPQRRPKQRRSCTVWHWMAALLFLAGILAIPVLIYLTVFRSSQLSSAQNSEFNSKPFHYRIAIQQETGAFFPNSEEFPLGRAIQFELPPLHLVFGKLHVAKDAQIWANFTLSPNARIVLFARHLQRPTPGLFDWQRILSGENLHQSDRKRIGRVAFVNHFLQSGEWHFGFLNDRNESATISLLIRLDNPTTLEESPNGAVCQFDCFGKGQCQAGICLCYPGYGGTFCEETVCPVLCSGQGVFSGGHCQCNTGFHGRECELPIGQCSDTECGGHGKCQPDGTCQCQSGWTGDDCTKRQECSRCSRQHGICHEGHCFCESGWTGEYCDREFMEGLVQHCDNECSGNGKCIGGQCHCGQGWTGPECAQVDCPFGCDWHGECLPSGECQCNPGWTGTNCQIGLGIEETFGLYLELCPQNCSKAGQCVLGADGWHCECAKGHFGEHCEFEWESDCEDGVDNDGDGLIDCEDSTECCAHPNCLSNALCIGPAFTKEMLLQKAESTRNLSFPDRIRFLFDGGELSVQRYADTQLFDPKRLSVLRGRIFSKRGGPLAGVRISNAHSPQQGFSLSRAGTDTMGQFEFVVNGGSVVTLQFVRQPYGRVLHSFYVPSNKILDVGIVWMDATETANNSSNSACVNALERLQFTARLFLPNKLDQNSKNINGNASDIRLLVPSARVNPNVRTISLQIPITSDHSLLYSSNLAAGRQEYLHIQILGEKLPKKLLLIFAEMQIAGKRTQQKLSPKANLETHFTWDRENIYWQREAGLVRGKISIGYKFADCSELLWQHLPFHFSVPPPTSDGFPIPWSITSIHRLHPDLGLLQKGNGELDFFAEDQARKTMRNLFGSGEQQENPIGSRRRAQNVQLTRPIAIVGAPDGCVFIGDGETVLKLSSDSQWVDILLRLDPKDASHPYYLAIDHLSSALFISLPLRKEIWRISDDGSGNYQVVSNGQKGMLFPKGIVFDAEDNLLVADGRRIVQLDKEGNIHRVLISDIPWRPLRRCARIAPLDELVLEWPTTLTIDPTTGQLFILDSSNLIYRLDFQLRTASLIVGVQQGCERNNNDILGGIDAMAFCPFRGTLYLASSQENVIQIIESATSQPTNSLQKMDFNELNGLKLVAILPNGDLLIANSSQLLRLEAKMPEFDAHEGIYRVNDGNSGKHWEFDKFGRHIRTIGPGQLLREMRYDDNGELVEIEDGNGKLVIESVKNGTGNIWDVRDEQGIELIRMETEIDDNGNIVQKITGQNITHPFLFEFHNDQLLNSISMEDQRISLNYEPGTGLLNSWKNSEQEWKIDGPALNDTGHWRSRVRFANEEEKLELWGPTDGAVELLGNG